MNKPTLKEQAHGEIEKIFRILLPQNGLSVREEQITLCHAMLDTLLKNNIALCDAGVGIGKTYAYLTACILLKKFAPHGPAGSQPVVISTSSVALQDSIIEEYIPFLSRIFLENRVISKPIRAIVRKGKERFVCDARLSQRLEAVKDKNKNAKQLKALLSLRIPKLNGEPIWSYTGILYILTNERYIGDELFQKRYTTDTLPFQKKINRGQKKQYYAEDTHDPIISREVFRKAQELLKRKSERHGHQNNGQYTFTSLIVCDECGTNFCRRIAKNQRVLWTCRKHFKGKHLCSMESLNETEIQQCFLTLYKKLAENRQEILGSYLRQLEELKDKDFMAHPDAMELNRQIAGLLEQNHTLHRLRAKECIDSAFFIAQSNELSQKISNLKAELKQYRDLNEYADFIDNTRLILTILDSPMPVFSSSVFRNIVSRITVTHETLRFQLVNGLELEEERISGG